MRFRRFASTLAFAATLAMPHGAWAVSKEMIQLQTQVQALQDAVARLQQSNDERMGVMRDLVQQTADSVNKMSQTVDGLQRQLNARTEADGGKLEQVSGQVQSLNDSIDELKARLARIEKSIGDLQSGQQSINAHFADTPAAGSPAVTAPASPVGPDTSAPARTTRGGKPSAAIPATPSADPPLPAAPPVEELYQTGLGDYNGAKYALATAEFSDVIRYYPDAPLAGNSNFYLGEIEYKAGKFSQAQKHYDAVIEQYPGNAKIPTAQLRKAQCLIALKQNDAAARELRSLVARYPNSPEAVMARARLNAISANSRR